MLFKGLGGPPRARVREVHRESPYPEVAFARAGGIMKIVHLRKAKALKGNRSRSFQLLTPDTVGTEHMLVTYVEILPGGSTPPHAHGKAVESMYFIVEGRGEAISGKETRAVGPDTAVYFPPGSRHGIRNLGKTKLRYLACHVPPYDIESLYKTWEGALLVLGG